MAKRAVENDIRVVDPMFAIPEGLYGYRYSEAPVSLNPEGNILAGGNTSGTLILLDSNQDRSGAPGAPNTLVVVDQILRTAPDGHQVIDMVVEVDDIQAAVRYDVRVSQL